MHDPLNIEQQLLAAYATGERIAAEKIYNQQFPIVNGWLLKNGGNENDAADIFQEAMVILFEKAQQETFRLTCRIGTYVFAVSKHLWYKKLQRVQRQPDYLPAKTGADESPDDLAYEEDINVQREREIHFEQLSSALDRLGEPCSSLLKAFYHHDKSMQEIAADFGYTNPDNAKTQKYKCLARLRKLFYGVQAK